MNKNTTFDLTELNAFLNKNKSVDFRKTDLRHKANLEAYRWKKNESKEGKARLLEQLRAYQRILRVLPGDDADLDTVNIAKALLKKGIHSSLQIAGTPKKTFIEENLKIFTGDESLAERVYKRAIACRKAVALKYINRFQSMEPHTRAAGLNR